LKDNSSVMAFKKGQSGNSTGRPKGAKNKTEKVLKIDEELRDKIGSFINEKIVLLFKKFPKLSADNQRKIIEGLLPYYLPKLQAISNTFNFEDMTDEQLDLIIDKIKKTAAQ